MEIAHASAGRYSRPWADWVDPRGPDGVTILAPYEQSRPIEYLGVEEGDGPNPGMLFNIQTDSQKSVLNYNKLRKFYS